MDKVLRKLQILKETPLYYLHSNSKIRIIDIIQIFLTDFMPFFESVTLCLWFWMPTFLNYSLLNFCIFIESVVDIFYLFQIILIMCWVFYVLVHIYQAPNSEHCKKIFAQLTLSWIQLILLSWIQLNLSWIQLKVSWIQLMFKASLNWNFHIWVEFNSNFFTVKNVSSLISNIWNQK